jgi:OOP family OmpA-OmpF porin
MKSLHLIAAALLLPAVASQAQTATGPYVGASVGYVRNNLDCRGFSDCNKSATGFKVFGGYQINDTFAVELSYFDFGTANAIASTSGGTAKIDVKSTGYGVRGLASFPANQNTRLFAALGVNRVKSDPQSVPATVGGLSSDTGTKPSFAVGVDRTLMPNLVLRGELEATRFSGPDNIGSYNNTNLSIGLRYAF